MSQVFRDPDSDKVIVPFHEAKDYVWAFVYREKGGGPLLHTLRIKRIRIRRIIVLRDSKGDDP